MKKAKSTEKLIKDIYTDKLQVTTSSNLDEKVLANSMSILDKVKSKKSAIPQPGIWSVVTKSKIAQIATAVVVIVATSLFLVQQEQPGEIQTQKITKTSKSPSELLTIASLNLAYRHGGIKAVEEQSLKALGMVAVANSNIKQLQIEYFKNNGI